MSSPKDQQKLLQRAFKDALLRDDLPGMRRVLEDGALSQIPPAIGTAALFLAMKHGEAIPPALPGALTIVQLLLLAGVDPNSTNKAGACAAYVAAESQFLPAALESMLKAGANPNGTSPATSPIRIAVVRGNSKAVDLLMQAGAEINITFANGWNLMHEAVRGGREEIIVKLLKAGLSINEADAAGFTPLHYAMSNGKAGTPALLLKHGADIHARSSEGFTPALYAAKLGRLDAFDLLVDAGADPLARDNEGRSAFDWSLKHHWNEMALTAIQRYPSLVPTDKNILDAAFVQAVRDGNTGVARILVAAGADVGQKPGGRTLLQCAPNGNEELKRLLRSVKTGASIESAMPDESATCTPSSASSAPVL